MKKRILFAGYGGKMGGEIYQLLKNDYDIINLAVKN